MVSNNKIRLAQVFENQIPDFVNDDFPLFKDFLKQYQESLEYPGASQDILSKIDNYVNLDVLLLSPDETTSNNNFSKTDTTLSVVSTNGFPSSYGLLKIGSEIITYKSKTDKTFEGCVRGFTGITEIGDEIEFSSSVSSEHFSGSKVENLSGVFIKVFFEKLKRQIAPGFEGRELPKSVNSRLFYKHVNDFYRSKGSAESFKILFNALYGVDVQVIRPSDFVFEPSAASSRRVVNLVVYAIDINQPDLTDFLLNRTLFQKKVNSQDINQDVSASGTITNVERIERGSQRYYIISLDDDYAKDTTVRGTISGNFEVTKTTRVTENHAKTSSILYVDSTIGFDRNRSLDAYLDNGLIKPFPMSNRTLNEFHNVRSTFDIPRGTLVSAKNYAYVENGDTNIYFRVTNVLTDIPPSTDNYYSIGDPIKFNTLGLRDSDKKYNNWTFNVTPTYNISSIEIANLSRREYSVTLEAEFDLVTRDNFYITSSTGDSYDVRIISRNSANTYVVSSTQRIEDYNLSTKKFVLERKLNKGKFKFFPEANTSVSDVQNVYRPKDLSDTLFVASSSLPNYFNENLNVNDRRITFSVSLPSDVQNKQIKVGSDATTTSAEKTHSFYTGDAIIYKEDDDNNRLSIPNGRYYVTVVDNKNIKLSVSLAAVHAKDYVTIEGSVTDNTFYYFDLFDIGRVLSDDSSFELKSKKLFKKFVKPVDQTNKVETTAGTIGILKNGVEILNYKSKNSIFYGPIEEISVIAEGDNYDIVNPPSLIINDGSNADGIANGGIGATGNFEVKGSILDVKVRYGGFNYRNTPVVKVTGGNGTDCIVNPVMEKYTHIVDVNADSGFFVGLSTNPAVGISSNVLKYSEGHYFYPGERVIYDTRGRQEIVGLKNGSTYYVGLVDNFTFSLHNNRTDAENLNNPIEFLDYGSGIHILESVEKKQRIAKFNVTYSTDDYTFRKVSYDPSLVSAPIDFYTSTINVPGHGFSTGEIITYNASTSPISGLTSGTNYSLTKIDDDNFKLSEVGVGITEFVTLTSSGVGRQYFQYPNIAIEIDSSKDNINELNVTVPPEVDLIARGKIKSVFLENNGIGYGSTNIINYDKQPVITANSGDGATLKPIIIGGQIINILIQTPGSGYVSTPSITIEGAGSGIGADLVPVITDGKLTDVIIRSPGNNYDANTSLKIITAGGESKFKAKITSWNINNVGRNFNSNQIYEDDGFITQDSRAPFGDGFQYSFLQYSHAYVPRKLRRSIYNKKVVNGKSTFNPDLVLDAFGRETDSTYHSPIIGWAYDGNPIYGPYGFANPDGSGGIKKMVSGYKRKTLANRPSVAEFPLGFFVNDFQWTNEGDLDVHNGRFAITPEYPKGVYAYYATIGDNDESFQNYKIPTFPYFIGNTFKSKPIPFNFDATVSQELFTQDPEISTINENYLNYDLLRNITPYNISSSYGKYDYLYNPTNIADITSKVERISSGSLNDFDISIPGQSYKVNDKIIFEQPETGTIPLAKVVSIAGTGVTSISIGSSTISGIDFYGSNNRVIGICTSPHNLTPGRVNIYNSNNQGNTQYFAEIGVPENVLRLKKSIGTPAQTGIITYFEVTGLESKTEVLPPRANDIYTIKSDSYREEIRILNIDSKNSRIKVEREVGGSIGTSYNAGAGTYLEENSRIFIINSTSENLSKQPSILNEQYYFNPAESVGVGIGTTLSISNPGTGATQIFVDAKKIYLPSNTLKLNDIVYYESDGSGINVTSIGDTFPLIENRKYYAHPFPGGFVGLSSRPVGLGTTGPGHGLDNTDVTLFTFTSWGTGEKHSLKTNYNANLRKTLSRTEVTVNTENNHGLIEGDSITFDCKPNTEKTYKVIFNEETSKFGVGYFDFVSGDVNTDDNSITISNHGLSSGQKVILESQAVPGGLVGNKAYFVIVNNSNNISLSLNGQDKVAITSQSYGRLLIVNPPLKLVKNQTLVFDLSDSSLSYSRNNTNFFAVKLKFFYDKNLTNEFISSKKTSSLSVLRTGTPNVDAKVKLVYDDHFPEELYYNLEPLVDDNIPARFTSVSLDSDVNNIITFVDSQVTGSFSITNVENTSFKFAIFEEPEDSSYTSGIASLTYSTISTTASGPINHVKFITQGSGLLKLPQISRIQSGIGTDAVILPQSNSIGRAELIDIDNIGFEFPTDTTLRPRAYAPTVVKVEALKSIGSVDVLTSGKNYTILPDLILIDGFTNKVRTDVDLKLVYDDGVRVEIVRNTKTLYDVNSTIIPINNSNGFKISNISYDSSTKDATVTLNVVGFTTLTDWPFEVGSKFLLEGVSTKDLENDEGYNSSQYGYRKLYEVKTSNPNLGNPNPSFTFNMSEFVEKNNPGEFNDLVTSARAVPESYFPTFKINRVDNKFFADEIVSNGTTTDRVVSWDVRNQLLKIFTSNPELYKVGDTLLGKTSNTTGDITEIVGISSLTYNIGPVKQNESIQFTKKGFLNEPTQRLHDSDYYQYFSYSLKSTVGISTWGNSIESLNHPSGMKKFSELQILSDSGADSQINLNQTESVVSPTADFVSFYDLNCVYDADIVTENNIDNALSNEVLFKSLLLTDHTASANNRVLLVDDVSSDFNSNPRATSFSVVDRFTLRDIRSKKYVLFSSNKRYPGERQMIIVNFIHDDFFGFLTQYGRVETASVHGYFDIGVFQTTGLLLFYPIDYEYSDFNLSGYSFVSADALAGISSQSLGDIAKVDTQQVNVPQGTNTAYKIVGIDSSYTSSKIMVTIEKSDNSYYQYDEFNVTHDGTNIYETEFSTLATDNYDLDVSLGIGTYQVDYSGGEVQLSIVPPNVGLSTDYLITSTIVSISNTSRVSTGTSTYNTTRTAVAYATTSVGAATSTTEIIEFESQYKGCNIYASIEDLTNGVVEFSELVVTHDETNTYISEFGRVVSDEDYDETGIGTFSSELSSGKLKIFYEPLPNREVQVRIFVNSLQLVDSGITTTKLTFNDAEFSTLYGDYVGSQNEIKRSFELRHKGELIFERSFDASLIGTSISVEQNVLILPNHYFVTGEKVKYTYGEGSTPIGIVTTNIAGIGTTDILPTDLYVIRVDGGKIKLADSAENALKFNPEAIGFSTIGLGTDHTITAVNQDAKGIFTIDNMLQSPIIKTEITTTLSTHVPLQEDLIDTVGITSFFASDVIQINDEVMLIENVGVGSFEKLRVRRPWLGTELGIHSAGDTVYKLSGDYKIVGSSINFTSPPYGRVPLSVDVNQFGIPYVDPSDRDFTGITTSSTFHGRTFMRSGIEDSTEETYSKNYIFDDISTRFTGIRTSFDLKVNGSNVTGISTNNAILLVKDIFQQPSRIGPSTITGNYTLEESGGATSIVFEPTTLTPGEDINTSGLPIGGVIVSAGSTRGRGYQPLVAAGGTATISGLGSITSINIGYYGSGYRSGIQTVNVYVRTQSFSNTTTTPIGIATISDGRVTGVAVTNNQIFYVPKDISNVGYNSISGIATITTSENHGLETGESIILSGIAFTCDYYAPINITNALYDNVTGVMTVTTASNHDLSPTGRNSTVVLSGIAFTCSYDGGVGILTHPRESDPNYCGSKVLAVNSATEFVVNVGPSTAESFYNSGGTVQSAIIVPRKNNNSESGQDFAYGGSRVLKILDNNTFEVNVGTSTITHFYSRCGKVEKKFKVIFDAPLGYTNIPLIYSNDSVQGIGTKASIDLVVSNDTGIDDFKFNNTGYGYGSGEILTIAIGGTIGIPTETSTSVAVSGATYDNVSGVLTVTTSANHNLYAGIGITFNQLVFECDSGGGLSTAYFPPSAGDGNGPDRYSFYVDSITSSTEFVTNVGPSTISHSYVTGGSVSNDPLVTSFDEFQVTIDNTYSDEFSAWTIGNLYQLDSIDQRFDGVRKVFPLTYQGVRTFVGAKPGSIIDVPSTLLVFINDILQVPYKSYTIRGGSTIEFMEPLPKGYTSKILYYRGTESIDIEDVQIKSPIEEGDTLKINSDINYQKQEFRQDEIIISADIVETNSYTGIGRLNDETIERPVLACKQTEDIFVNGEMIPKTRKLYEPDIFPNTNIIQSVGVGSTIIWVQNVRTMFDNANENLESKKLGKIEIVSQDQGEVGVASVGISTLGTVTSATIVNAGAGYTFVPSIVIGIPTSGSGVAAAATCTITDGSITAITITSGGSGYGIAEQPAVLIERPRVEKESIEKVVYDGDFGTIVSLANTDIVGVSTGLKMGFHIPLDSFLVNTGVTTIGFATGGVTGILTDYYFVASNTTVGGGITSLYNDGSVLGISTENFNNVYQVYDIEQVTQEVAGIGLTDVVIVTTLVSSRIDELDIFETFDSTLITVDVEGGQNPAMDDNNTPPSFYGDFSWGRLVLDTTSSRKEPRPFDSHYYNGYTGVTTSPVVRRTFPLQSESYTLFDE